MSAAQFQLPHGDDVITVRLTVREAIALGMGEKFHLRPDIAAGARRKMKRSVTEKLLNEARKSEVEFSYL